MVAESAPETRNAPHAEPDGSPTGEHFAEAVAMLVRLPLTDAERADAVRRLLVGVGRVLQVVHGEDQRLGEPAILLLVLDGVLPDLLDNLAVGVRRRDPAFDFGDVELSLVLQEVELLGSCHGVDQTDLLALVQEDAVHADIGADLDGIVIDQIALANGPVVRIPVDHVLEVGGSMGRGRCRQPDLTPLAEWVGKQPGSDSSVNIPEERPAEMSPSPMFDPNAVYFGRRPGGKGRTASAGAQMDCASNGQAKLIVRLANVGLSGWVNVPADEAPCLAVLRDLDARLHAARRRFDELADSRTGDPRLQAQIVDQLMRWFMHGRSAGGPAAADTTKDADEAA